jgi:5-methylcytosine-specific restriction endonuclease McrA
VSGRKRKPKELFSLVFERDGRKCMYCPKDFMQDFDTFWTAQIDRLVPSGDYVPENVVLACFVCNNLRGRKVPLIPLLPDNRDAYIEAIRQLIDVRREEKRKTDFASWHPTSPTPTKLPAP